MTKAQKLAKRRLHLDVIKQAVRGAVLDIVKVYDPTNEELMAALLDAAATWNGYAWRDGE